MRTALTKNLATPFELLTQLITVRDLCDPIQGKYEISQPVADVNEAWIEQCAESGQDPMDQIALATENGRTVGWIGFDMLMSDKSIRECFEPLRPDAMLAAGTPVIEAVKAMSNDEPHFYFILDENRISGWLGYAHLYKLPFRLCLLALLLGIEHLASDLIKREPDASLAVLSPERVAKLKPTYKNRGFRLNEQSEEYPSLLLDCTMFADKVKILKKLFVAEVPAARDKLFETAEKLRNSLAHPRDEDEIVDAMSREKLVPFIAWAGTIHAELENALRRR